MFQQTKLKVQTKLEMIRGEQTNIYEYYAL